jgi:hypothetical protein
MGFPAKRIFNIIDPAPFVFRHGSRLKPVFLTNRILEPLYVECVLRAFALVQQHYPVSQSDGRPQRAVQARSRTARCELCLRNTGFIGRVPTSGPRSCATPQRSI